MGTARTEEGSYTPLPPICAEALVVRARRWFCALPIEDVVEVFRPRPFEPVAGAPVFVRGVAVVRGSPVPVVELGALLGGELSHPGTRFVTVRTQRRVVALEVDEIVGVRELSASDLAAAAPLLGGAAAGLVASLAALDGDLLAVLDCARLIDGELLDGLAIEGWA
jgi:purine-binding chemotaxis protein CheW